MAVIFVIILLYISYVIYQSISLFNFIIISFDDSIVLKKGVIYLDQHKTLNFGNETKNKSWISLKRVKMSILIKSGL